VRDILVDSWAEIWSLHYTFYFLRCKIVRFLAQIARKCDDFWQLNQSKCVRVSQLLQASISRYHAILTDRTNCPSDLKNGGQIPIILMFEGAIMV
jgi:hypothetical protein